jgi:hypothetical protein
MRCALEISSNRTPVSVTPRPINHRSKPEDSVGEDFVGQLGAGTPTMLLFYLSSGNVCVKLQRVNSLGYQLGSPVHHGETSASGQSLYLLQAHRIEEVLSFFG